MNKIKSLGIALLSVFFVSCGDNDDCPSSQIEGTYKMTRTIRMETPAYFPFTPVTQTVSVTIKPQGENHTLVTLPGASYKLNGQEMVLPSFTIVGVPVINDLEGGVVIPSHDFKMNVGRKDVIGNIKGELDADGDIELDVKFKFGSMPYLMVQEYERDVR